MITMNHRENQLTSNLTSSGIVLIPRRTLLISSAASFVVPIMAQTAPHPHAHHGGHYERLNQAGLIDRPPLADSQAFFDSPAPKAQNLGRWTVRASLPLPRSEMAWAASMAGRMHLVGGYGEQKVNRSYHHVYDPAANRWMDAAPLPLGANHVGVVTLDGVLYAMGGFVEQNRKPHAQCFAYSANTQQWSPLPNLPEPCGSLACIAHGGLIHTIGGAVGDTFADKRSVNWHWTYDPLARRWDKRAPLPTARDHVAAIVHNGLIHVVGGRVDSFHTNSNLHHIYNPQTDKWEARNPLPTTRSGHGAGIIDGRLFIMGGEGTNRVFGQNEGYDFSKDSWEQFAPMPTPRHGLGATTIGTTIYVAGGGALVGGGVQTSIHEAFALN
jgi:N-acetylneuraminic acid mutarotase